jgi:hypothetical protein
MLNARQTGTTYLGICALEIRKLLIKGGPSYPGNLSVCDYQTTDKNRGRGPLPYRRDVSAGTSCSQPGLEFGSF